MTALEGARQGLETDVVRAPVAAEDEEGQLVLLGQSTATTERLVGGFDAAADR